MIDTLTRHALPIFVAEQGASLEHLEALKQDVESQLDPNYSNNAQPLDRFVYPVIDRIGKEILDRTGDSNRPAILPFLNDLKERAENISCERCAGGTICQGKITDDDLVSQGGLCISQLKALFEIASTAAQVYYRHFLPEHSYRSIIFSTKSTVKKPHSINSDVFVSGHTEHYDDAEGEVAEVTLQICIPEFNRRSFLSTLYVLLHECIVHAYEGLVEPARAWDSFAEGWMDLIAAEILRQMGAGLGPAAELMAFLPSSNEYVDEGRVFEGERARVVDHKGPAVTIAVGRRAANRLWRRLRTHPLSDTRHTPDEAFMRISFDINVQNLPPDTRAAFVLALDSGLEPTPSDPSLPDRITNRIWRYLRGTDDARTMVFAIVEMAG